MELTFWSLLFLWTASATAISIPLRQQRRSSLAPRSGNDFMSMHSTGSDLAVNDNTLSLDNVHDFIYIANVTVGGNDYPVQLDTGSSDLWIQGPSFPLPNSVQSSIAFNLTYGIGWAYGTISYASTAFAGILIKNQSYLDVSNALNPALSYGAAGILGLGFTSLSSIDSVVNRTGSSAGRSLLFNAFNENPSGPNFISFALPRSFDPNNYVNGSLTIGEYVPQYQSIANSSRIPTWPVSSPRRWSILLDGLFVGNQSIPVASVISGVPSNTAVVLLDTGTSYTYAPPEVCAAIYGDIPGAQYNSTYGVWVVPCDAEIDVAFQINNQVYPIHPLDVSPYNYPSNQTCIGSFVSQSVSVASGQFDWLIGDNVLRSIYSVYDFGDLGKIKDPFVQLLALIDPNQASAEFAAVRGSKPRTNITYSPLSNFGYGPTITVQRDLSSTLDKLNNYIPAMLAVMALNALVVILFLIVGIVYICRRRRRGTARKNRGRMSPMPLSAINTDYRSSEQISPGPHVYEPISMALTDDTVIPPSPAFRQGGPHEKRPMSMSAVDDPFLPPSPAFLKKSFLSPGGSNNSETERPKSVA